MHEILQNIQSIQKRIHRACELSERNPDELKLLMATKTVSSENIKIALQSGELLIAENKVQEVKEKYRALFDMPHVKHFIGHLQTNKIKELLKYDIRCVESVDRFELAEQLHKRLLVEKKSMEILIQVNTSNEKTKFGIAPEKTIDLIRKISEMETLHIKGLMTIGLFSADTEKIRNCFKLLKSIQQKIINLQIPNVEMKELSMGMSGDLEIAIEEGATIIRVGTAIFGKRIHPDSYYWNENKA